MTATSVMRNPGSALLVWCLGLAVAFLAACGGDQPALEMTAQPGLQPTPEMTAQPSPQPTPGTIVQPEAGEEMHYAQNPTWFVAPSLEEQIYDALDSDTLVVVRASLQSTTAKAETVPGSPTSYRPVHELKFTVHEYLEGSGPNEVLVVVRGDRTYATETLAIEAARIEAILRNSSWDDQQAVLFIELDETASQGAGEAEGEGATASSSIKTATFLRSNPQESAWDYTVDNLSRAWLPALAAGGATGESSSLALRIHLQTAHCPLLPRSSWLT